MAAILNSAILASSILHKKYFTHSFWLNLMMAAILNSAILASAILHKKHFTHSFWLNFMMTAILISAILNLAIFDSAIIVFSFNLTHTFQDWSPPFAQKNFTRSFWLNLMMTAILISAILNLAILDSTIIVFSFNLSHTCQDWFPPFAQKNFTHSFWLNLMMAAILISAMFDSDTALLDSDTLLSSLRFTQKHSHSTLTLTQTNSIWLKLTHSHLTWWWQPSWIMPSWIWRSWIQPS